MYMTRNETFVSFEDLLFYITNKQVSVMWTHLGSYCYATYLWQYLPSNQKLLRVSRSSAKRINVVVDGSKKVRLLEKTLKLRGHRDEE